MIATAKLQTVTDNDEAKPLPHGWRWARMVEVIAEARNGLYKPDTF